MALINIAAALQRADELLHRLQPPAGLQIRTHKRNRGLIIRKLAQDRFLVRERGYLDKAAGRDELHCQLKSRAKREFPRSRKVRLCQLQGREEVEQAPPAAVNGCTLRQGAGERFLAGNFFV